MGAAARLAASAARSAGVVVGALASRGVRGQRARRGRAVDGVGAGGCACARTCEAGCGVGDVGAR